MDTLRRLTWVVILSFLVGVGGSINQENSRWLLVLAFVVVGLMLWLAITVKGLWAIAFFAGLDLAKKALPKSIKEQFPGIDKDGFQLLRGYCRIFIAVTAGTATMLLLYAFLPIWESPWAITGQLLALVILLLTSLPPAKNGKLLSGARFGLGVFFLAVPIYLTGIGVEQDHFGTSEYMRWAKAKLASNETEVSRSRANQELNQKVTYARVIAPGELLTDRTGSASTGVKVQAGEFVQLINARPEQLDSTSSEPMVQVRVRDGQGPEAEFTSRSRIGYLPLSKLRPTTPEEYREWLASLVRDQNPATTDTANIITLKASNSLTGVIRTGVIILLLLIAMKYLPWKWAKVGCALLAILLLLGLLRVKVFQVNEQTIHAARPPTQLRPASASGGGCLTNAPAEYVAIVNRYLQDYPTVPRNIALAVIQVESGWNPNAQSEEGAKGLMQLMDGTAAEMGVSDSFNPEENIRGGIRYLAIQIDRFQSTDLALAAYHDGPERIANLPGNTLADITPYLGPRGQRYVPTVIALARRECRSDNQTLTAGGTQPPAATTFTPEPIPASVSCDFAVGPNRRVRVVNRSSDPVLISLLSPGCVEDEITLNGNPRHPRGAWGFDSNQGRAIVVRNARTGRIALLDPGPGESTDTHQIRVGG